MVFEISLRIYIEDTDAGGIVFYGNYLKFFERARTDFLRSIGIEQSDTIATKLIFVVKSIHIDYKIPARLDDMIIVTSSVKRFQSTRVVFGQSVRRMGDNAVLCTGEVEVVSVNMDTLKPVAMSKSLRLIFKNELENTNV